MTNACRPAFFSTPNMATTKIQHSVSGEQTLSRYAPFAGHHIGELYHDMIIYYRLKQFKVKQSSAEPIWANIFRGEADACSGEHREPSVVGQTESCMTEHDHVARRIIPLPQHVPTFHYRRCSPEKALPALFIKLSYIANGECYT